MLIFVEITEVDTVYARLSIFTSSKSKDVITPGIGLAGRLCVDAELLKEFVSRLNPDRIIWGAEAPEPEWIKKAGFAIN